MSISFDPAASNNAPAGSQPSKTADPLTNKNTFLQLLVAQIKNQNPLNPTDGVQFLTQLAQFTQVEQSTQMSEDLSAIKDLLQKAAAGTQPAATNS